MHCAGVRDTRPVCSVRPAQGPGFGRQRGVVASPLPPRVAFPLAACCLAPPLTPSTRPDVGVRLIRGYSAEWSRGTPRLPVLLGHGRSRLQHRWRVLPQVSAGCVELLRGSAMHGARLLAMRRSGVRIPSAPPNPLVRGCARILKQETSMASQHLVSRNAFRRSPLTATRAHLMRVSMPGSRRGSSSTRLGPCRWSLSSVQPPRRRPISASASAGAQPDRLTPAAPSTASISSASVTAAAMPASRTSDVETIRSR